MALAIGIVGLPNVGKSTLFNALLKKQQALAANYPFATIEPNVGIVPVPDKRLARLAETIAASRIHTEGGKGKEALTYHSLPPLVPATVTFVDIAGIVKGASEGEGLGNKFLAHIREAEAIALVLRSFTDPDVVMTGDGEVKADGETVMTELILADMETLAKQQPPKGVVEVEGRKRWEAIEKIKEGFDRGLRAADNGLSDEEKELIRDLNLMTMKPVIYVINVGEAELMMDNTVLQAEYADRLGVDPDRVVIVSAKVEAELSVLSEREQVDYLTSMGFQESGLERLIRVGYRVLGLQSFLTAGEIECRAWTIKQGSTAVEASGVIHTDFMKKFIKADIIDWQDFVSLGGWKKAREAGRVRVEGRDYLMKDGEVVEFRIGQ